MNTELCISKIEFTLQGKERWKRIKLSLAACAYEFYSNSIMSDKEFDDLARSIDPSISTIENYHDPEQIKRYKKLDKFFRTKFRPYTGQWVWEHPELDRLKFRYERIYNQIKIENIGCDLFYDQN